MPLSLIFKSVNIRNLNKIGDYDDWFYKSNKGIKMKSIVNPFKWASYAKMLVKIDTQTRSAFGGVNLYNIEQATPFALEALTKEALSRNLSAEEFAYVLYSMNKNNIAYMGVFALESMYGKIPPKEREHIADGVANMYYKIMSGLNVREDEIARIYLPIYTRLGISPPA